MKPNAGELHLVDCRNISSKNFIICDIEYGIGHNTNSSKVIVTVFLLIMMLVCIFGNLVMCLLFHRYRRLRTVPNYFIVSLSISDLIVGLIAIPLWISIELIGVANLPLTSKMNSAMQFTDTFCCTSSIVNLTAVSIERFFGVRKPLKHRTFMSTKVTNCFLVSIWVYSAFITLLQFTTIFKNNYLIFIFVMGFLLPTLVMCGSYTGIYLAVRYRKRRRKSSCSISDISITKSLFIVTSVFITCWTPFFICVLLFKYCVTCTFIDTIHFNRLEKFTKWLHYSNSALNPIIYGACNVNFRTCFKDFFKCFYKMQGDVRSQTDEMTQDLRSSFFRQSTAERQSVHREEHCEYSYSYEAPKDSPILKKNRRVSNAPLLEGIDEEKQGSQLEKLYLENIAVRDNENDNLFGKAVINGISQEFCTRFVKSKESEL